VERVVLQVSSGRPDSVEGDDVPGAAPVAGEKWNFNVLLVQGTCVDAVTYLASPRLVIPFVYIAIGAPVFIAGLLLPLVQFSRLVTQIVAAPVVKESRTRKWYIMLGSVVTASALTMVGLATKTTSVFLVVTIFLAVAHVLGVVRGLNGLAYNDLLGRVLRKTSRNSLIYIQATIAGAVAIAVSWGSLHLLKAKSSLDSHLELLWAGVGVSMLAAILIVTVREPPKSDSGKPTSAGPAPLRKQKSYFGELRAGVSEVANVPWFRRYMATRVLMLSVELAMPFYAIHAATLHAERHGSLSTFVIASSIAVVVGGPMWRLVGKISQRYVLALGAFVAAVGGVWAILIDNLPALQNVIAHGLVFSLVAAGTQGVVGARTIYIVNTAPEDERPYFVAIGNTISGSIGILIAFVFGTIAHVHGVIWPLILITGFNVAAGISCFRLQETATR
jgi:hypothetical protein